MASSFSSSSKHRKSYDVFLSFRGMDVRNYFLGHLYTALVQSGINTYMDSEDLKKGEQISPALMEVIEESQIAIIVFSKDFTSSLWLEEVAKIMECKEQRGLVVLPVFYKVEPRDVRGQIQGYAEAMAKHEVKFGEDSEKVKRWKKALLDAGSLSGWRFMDGDEVRLIQRIVEEISTQLDKVTLHVAKYPVGIDAQVQELQTIINLQSKDDILVVGLWGQGGIGKTTIAKAIYNAIFREFEGSSFLNCVRENSNNSTNLVHLQKKLLSQVLRKELTFFSVDEGSQLIQDRLCNRKVLIILDDVDDERQLDALAGNCEWFGKGSRIIITTRDKHLLTCHGVNYIHKVKPLEKGEALELFREHAFPRSKKLEIRGDLIDRALHYANGLPLALEVLGSFLRGREENQWESALKKLAKGTHRKTKTVHRESFDALDYNERDILLDIACFFKGMSAKYIKEVLDSCDFSTNSGVQSLIELSLIREEEGTLQMHDLIQLMGMDIVKEECPDDPGKRSRLWHCDDVLYVLSEYMGTAAIEAIVLELPKRGELYIHPHAFTNMRKLRLLIMRNIHYPFPGPIYLPDKLRWFEWPHCPLIPAFGNGEKMLVGLDLRNTNIEEVLKQFKDFKHLKFINFSECQSLVCMPDLNCTPYLEELDLHGCKNLKCAHESVANHDRLRLLNLSGCSKIQHLPSVLWSKNLELLNLNHCSKLQRFPDIPNKIKSLRGLYLIGTSIEKLPVSIENLVSLEEMDLRYCKELAFLPSSIYRLLKLERLTLEGCSKLDEFPKYESPSDSCMKTGFPKLFVLNLRGCNLSKVDFLENDSCFPFLRALYLLGNNFTDLPTCRQLHNLLRLDVSYYQQLHEIPQNSGQLSHLWSIDCESLSKFRPDELDLEAGYPVAEGRQVRERRLPCCGLGLGWCLPFLQQWL